MSAICFLTDVSNFALYVIKLNKSYGHCTLQMVVTDVYNHRFHKVFSLTESLTQILDRDDIFV